MRHSESEECPPCRGLTPNERTEVQTAISRMPTGGAAACRNARNWIVGIASFKEPVIGINESWLPNDGNYGAHYRHWALPANGYYHVHLNTFYLGDPLATADTLWHEAGHHMGWSEAGSVYFASRCQAGQDPGPVW